MVVVMDIFTLYPIVWLFFMLMGMAGYAATRGKPSGYFLFQLVVVALVLFLFRDTFGAVEESIWMLYAIGFATYIAAFLVGASTEKVQWVIVFQSLAFGITYMVLPYAFGFVVV